MNTAKAFTEPYVRLHELSAAFDKTTYSSTGAWWLLRRNVDDVPDDPLLRSFILATGEWTQIPRLKTSFALVEQASRLSTQVGVMYVFSLFDDFLTGVDAEAEREKIGVEVKCDNAQSEQDANQGASLERVCKRLGLSIDKFSQVLPLFQYFRIARNCVAHRSGRASPAFVEHARKQEVKEALKSWFRRKPSRTVELPLPSVEEPIALAPRHAILVSAICLRIAGGVNDQLVSRMGADGLLRMATRYALLVSSHPSRLARQRGPEQAVSRFLSNRYHVTDATTHQVAKRMNELGVLKEASNRYAELYGNRHRQHE